MNEATTELPSAHRSTQDINKLARLVDIRQRASLDEIANVIDNDHAVTGPLMERAYPRAPVRQAATVQMATSRVGINYIIVLLITDLVTQFVLETFQEMVGLYLTKDDPALMAHDDRSYVVATVRFKGKASGTLFFIFSTPMTLHMADRVLEPGVEMSIENMNAAAQHVIGELAKKLEVGLNSGRLPSTVEPPVIEMMDRFPQEHVPGGTTEEFFFRQGTHGMRVHLCVSPLKLG